MDKQSNLLGQFKVTKKIKYCEYGKRQHFNYIITYEWPNKLQRKLEMLGREKHSSLLDAFVSYEEMEVL
jgi:hypothetical protein